MKNIVCIVAIMATFVLTSCKKEKASSKVKSENIEAAVARDAEISKGVPFIEWDKTEHDFGILDNGEKVETVFTLTNTGEGDLVITGARGSCGCTVPDWPKTPVKPGNTAKIKVAFNSTNKKNKTTNTVTLTTNTEKGNEVVRIKAFVNPKKKS